MASANNPLLFIISEPVGSPLANEVALRLADHGIRTWIGSLAPAGELDEAAMDAMQAASAALLIFDEAAAHSRHVDRHLLVARQTGKPFIPLRIEAADEALLRQELLDARWIDWAEAEGAIGEIVGRAQEYAAAAPEQGRADGTGAGINAASGAVGATDLGSGRRPSLLEAERSQLAAPETDTASGGLNGPAGSPPGRTQARSGWGVSGRITAIIAILALAVGGLALVYAAGTFSGGGDPNPPVAIRTGAPDGSLPEYAATTPAAQAATPEAERLDLVQPVTAEAQPVPAPSIRAETVAPPLQANRPVPTDRQDRRLGTADEADRPLAATQEALASGRSPLATVQAFYSALSRGDGVSAAQFVVPNKRESGPLSGSSLSRYYSSFRRPLRVRRLSSVNANTARVAYDYVLSDGRLCQGVATVRLEPTGDRPLVSGITTRGPC